jgi:hypothetical protein
VFGNSLRSKERATGPWLAAALPVLSSDCDLGATGGDSRAKAQEVYLAERFRSGARNSKFWHSIWKIYLKRTVYGAGSCRRFRILDLDPGFRRTRAVGRIEPLC